ncbi:class I SAM-dependent methyltransferase [Mesorhizobium sp. CAU 1741]|uniref:class I SAM-dependent methyltransferase n=1 Tax=Mesorhizobium sp. CAU 1741 TaxID=3140366 RepID=UPI00325BDA09
MTSWNEGYVSDIEYVPGFYLEQTPPRIDVACMLRNIEPPVAQGTPFTYCELGCGFAETALAIAAASHHSEVWGFDFNPAHIARGRAMAKAGGLGNIRLEEASFDQLARNAPRDMPAFDYIVLHGVWSWVSLENRAHIVTFIDRHLKPGGVAYVTYNALPGWTQALPIQRLLLNLARAGSAPSDRRVIDAIAALRDFAAAGAPSLPTDYLDRLAGEAEKGSVSYLAHEYLNEHWAPCFHDDVARDMAPAKLDYVATANLLENFPDLCLKPEQRQLVDAAPASQRETFKDYFMVRAFRRDVFMRGAREIPVRRRDQRMREQRLTLIVPPDALTRTIKVPLGEATLNEGFYAPAFAALAERQTMSVGELLDLPEADGSTANAREVLGMLTGSGQALPVATVVTDEARDVARAYNRHHLAICADTGRPGTALVAPALCGGVSVNVFEMLAYEVLVAGTPAEPAALARAAWALLQSRGDRISYEGAFFDGAEENLTRLQEHMEKIVAISLPFWQRIGAI